MQELNRFLHYYTRFKNHENSQKLEEPLLNAVRHKMEVLASSLVHGQQGEGMILKSVSVNLRLFLLLFDIVHSNILILLTSHICFITDIWILY